MIVEASLGYLGTGEILVQVGAAAESDMPAARGIDAAENNGGTYLYCLSSSMTWTPWLYCSAAGASPTAAKWPFMMGLVAGGGRGFEARQV